jgi:hypothetical protein
LESGFGEEENDLEQEKWFYLYTAIELVVYCEQKDGVCEVNHGTAIDVGSRDAERIFAHLERMKDYLSPNKLEVTQLQA